MQAAIAAQQTAHLDMAHKYRLMGTAKDNDGEFATATRMYRYVRLHERAAKADLHTWDENGYTFTRKHYRS